jgi:hypothetical protein
MVTIMNPTYNTSFSTRANMLRAVNDHEDAMFAHVLKRSLYAQTVRRLLVQKIMVSELVEIILEDMGEYEWVEVHGTRRPRQLLVQHNSIASIPPADGTCHFDRLPAELLKAVFSASLPPRSQVIDPRCGGARPDSLDRRDDDIRPNRVADLMVLSKKMCVHVAEMMYEERTFSIHVHQGQENAGIEFLHVSRQPLQYQADFKDGRFAKFSPGEIFGFSRVKKLEIRIFPSDSMCRHTAINTYYMLLALVNLLGRRKDEPENRITSLVITFVDTYPHSGVMQGRSARTAENPWWDAENEQPRETSFHDISDIQLMLQTFARLYGVHNVDIVAPAKVALHQPTVEFVRALKRCMQGKSQSATFNHTSLNAQLEGMRAVHEDYILRMMYGGGILESDKLKDLRDDDNDNDADEDEDNDEDDGYGGGDAPHDPGEDDGDDNDDSEDDDGDGDDGPDANMLREEDVEHKKHELSPASKDAGGGRKRVHFSDDTSSAGPSGPGESSQMDLDSPTSGNRIFGSLFTATESEIDFVDQFARICDTTEDEARYWLSESNWDIEVAALEYINSLELVQGLTPEEEDEIRISLAMTFGHRPSPAMNQDTRTGRDIDNGTSPTRSSRSDGPASRFRAQDRTTNSSGAGGPSARSRRRQRHLFEPLATQEEEAEAAKANGKGKGKAKMTDADEKDESSWNDPSQYDGPIAKWNDPSNFQDHEDDLESFNGHDNEMVDDGHGSHQTTQSASSSTDAVAGTPPGHSLAERNARAEWSQRIRSQLLEWNSSPFEVDSSETDMFQSALSEATNPPRAPSRISSTFPRINRPRSQRYYDGRAATYQSMHPGLAASFAARPCPSTPPHLSASIVYAQAPSEQGDSSANQGRMPLKERYLRLYTHLDSTDSSPRPDASQRFMDMRDDTSDTRSGYGYARQSAPPPPYQPSIPANTVDDYPGWAGTSYCSAPAATEPTPLPEIPAASSSTSHLEATVPYFVAPTTVTATSNQYPSSTTHPSRSRVLRSGSRTQGEAYAAGMTIDATPATVIAHPTTAVATSPPQYLANPTYWANFRPEAGDEVVYVSSDSEGEL